MSQNLSQYIFGPTFRAVKVDESGWCMAGFFMIFNGLSVVLTIFLSLVCTGRNVYFVDLVVEYV